MYVIKNKNVSRAGVSTASYSVKYHKKNDNIPQKIVVVLKFIAL